MLINNAQIGFFSLNNSGYRLWGLSWMNVMGRGKLFQSVLQGRSTVYVNKVTTAYVTIYVYI